MGIALADRVVAVTGGSSGIGEATALAYAKAGAAVAPAARRRTRTEKSQPAGSFPAVWRLRV
jgi:NAD(P)-dependent dehydrogenase (short-subunit alcohol dehydrogenase family)